MLNSGAAASAVYDKPRVRRFMLHVPSCGSQKLAPREAFKSDGRRLDYCQLHSFVSAEESGRERSGAEPEEEIRGWAAQLYE